jgi:hypothetical protein
LSELSVADQLYLNVGKCLTAWNRIEEQVLYLIEYAHSDERGVSNGSVMVGYWAVVSFEARLKWCNAVVGFSLRLDTHADLATRWNALNNKLITKARKRAEIAHGSVVTIREAWQTEAQTHFVPYYHRKRVEHMMRPLAEHLSKPAFFESTATLSVDELKERAESFSRARRDVVDFHRDWLQRDKETVSRE